MGAELATSPRNETQLKEATPVWRLRGLNLPAADSVPAAAQSHHASINLSPGLVLTEIAQALMSADWHIGI